MSPTGCPFPHNNAAHPSRTGDGVGRRGFLTAGSAALAALGLGGCASGAGAPGSGVDLADSVSGGDVASDAGNVQASHAQAARVPFTGEHQNAITHLPIPRFSSASAFRVTADDRAGLADMFAALTTTIADLMEGRMPTAVDPGLPPTETGILGDELRPDHLGIVVSVGASLFDDRFGLADRKPTQLVQMPFLANDRLDPGRSHGDLLVTIEADHEDTIAHALRQVMRATRRYMLCKWTIDGYARGAGDGGTSTPRNLMGFKDGTANLDSGVEDVMSEHVWVGPDDGEPEWAVGGSYHVLRVIRMLVEFWDRARLVEQEQIFGRHKLSGAPLGADDEFAAIDYSNDPDGERIPLDAHIRLANPRTPQTASDVMLRRGFSYTRGVDRVGQLDQGLAFVSYQRSLQQFLNTQERLSGEPLEEYITPEGGGFYFALPGVSGERESLGARLLA